MVRKEPLHIFLFRDEQVPGKLVSLAADFQFPVDRRLAVTRDVASDETGFDRIARGAGGLVMRPEGFEAEDLSLEAHNDTTGGAFGVTCAGVIKYAPFGR